ETVAEHFTSGSLFVYINKADEVKVRGFTDFKEYIDARLVDQRAAVVVADGGSLDTVNYHDQAIGLLHGAEYWVKPWIPSGYAYAFITGPAAPLVHRVPEAGPPGLRLMADNERYPLRAREWSHRFGIAVGNRLAGAVLDMNTGSGTYTQPTIT